MTPWWLCVTPCGICDDTQCARCPLRDRPVGLFVRQSDVRPATAINGPAQEADELLSVLQHHCTFGADGFLRLKGGDHDD